MYITRRIVHRRSYQKETVLVIGCGNQMNSERHRHDDCFTIDPDATKMPSVMARFGIDTMSFLPCSTFDMIWFEGFLLEAFVDATTQTIITDDVCTISSLLYLLKNEGIVRVSNQQRSVDVARKRDGKLQTVDGVCFVSDKDYLNFHDYCDKMLFPPKSLNSINTF